MMNRATAAAKVGMNHLRSLGFSAGRKNASSCHRMTGDVATMPAQSEILEAHGERLEGVDGLKRGHAVNVGQKLRDGHKQELAHGGGGHVEHDHGHGEAGDDAHKAHAQLAEVVE